MRNPDPTCATYQTTCAWDPGYPGTGVGAATTNVMSPGSPGIGGMMDAVTQEILNDYPKPNAGGWNASNYSTPGSGNMHNNYDVNVPVHDDTWQWDQRLDWNLSAKDQSYVRYSYTHEQLGFAPPLGPILDGGNVAPGRLPWFHQFQPGAELHGQRNPHLQSQPDQRISLWI